MQRRSSACSQQPPCCVDVVAEHAAIRAAVEGDAQALKPLLPRGVPYLHGHHPAGSTQMSARTQS